MTRIVFAATGYTEMAAALLLSVKETCAILLANPPATRSKEQRLLVREVHPAPDNAYESRTETKAQLRPEFLVPLVQRARQEQLSVIFVHTHPFAEGTPSFSPIDDEGEKHLAEFLKRRVPEITHAALVVRPDGCIARRLGSRDSCVVAQVGRKIDLLYSPVESAELEQRWDRQLRAFGSKGQIALQHARVAIVGLGGTASGLFRESESFGIGNLNASTLLQFRLALLYRFRRFQNAGRE